jgi:hypothetical protein
MIKLKAFSKIVCKEIHINTASAEASKIGNKSTEHCWQWKD